MDRTEIASSYAMALLWVAGFVALIVSVNIVTELVFVDFVHGNPHRSQSNSMEMMAITPPIFSVVAIIAVYIVFGPAQLLHAGMMHLLAFRYGRRAFLFAAPMLPVAGIVTWYSFDYLTPSNYNLGINEGPDWTPYQHGISPIRFLGATATQAIVTAFTLAYCNVEYFRLSRKRLFLGVLIVAILGGIAWGYSGAKGQYQFIDHPDATSPDAG